MFEFLLWLARVVKRIGRGAGTLQHMGPHPGTSWVVGLIAGAAFVGGWRMAAMVFSYVTPLFIVWCYERAALYEKFEQQLYARKLQASTLYGKFVGARKEGES